MTNRLKCIHFPLEITFVFISFFIARVIVRTMPPCCVVCSWASDWMLMCVWAPKTKTPLTLG